MALERGPNLWLSVGLSYGFVRREAPPAILWTLKELANTGFARGYTTSDDPCLHAGLNQPLVPRFIFRKVDWGGGVSRSGTAKSQKKLSGKGFEGHIPLKLSIKRGWRLLSSTREKTIATNTSR
jgi:hypothetical protein